MKRKELRKLSKKALMKHLKTVERENWTLCGQIALKDEEIGELWVWATAMDKIFTQIVRQNWVKIERLEAKLASYQAQFDELSNDDINNEE